MEVVASSSSSSPFPTPTRVKTSKYDVFISFRGEDTRNAFTAHLFEALRIRKVYTYLDEVTLKRGDEISPALLQAIQQSKISVIVFSENYADSSWCLDELVKIMECKEILGQQVVPIFYHVDPSCVRKQKGTYELEQQFKDKMEKLQIHGQAWRNALTKAADLSGWSTHQIRSESKLIEAIVEDIIKKLKSMSSSSAWLELAGIQRRMKQVESMLCLNSSSDRVIVVGLWGMGGIGKTTLARAVFDKISHQFEGCCFLSNVREEWDHGRKKYDLQKKLFLELLDEESKSMKMLSFFDRDRLLYKKVLIVLDDANDSEQLDFLTRDGEWFGLGSRIIITTRDMQFLKNRVDEIYKVEGLSFDEAFQHFQKNALRRKIPIAEFTELSIRAVKYAEGIPLVLQVLMGSLFSYNSKGEWRSLLDDLKYPANEKIHDVLKISYDGLTRKEKDVFLDIACFFKGKERSYAEGILKGCDSFVGMRIDNLVDKSLITIEKRRNSLWMHDLVQEMCWEIVFQQSINKPGKRSRLWNPDDVYHVFKNNKVSAMVEGIFLDVSKIKGLNLSPAVFLEANNLRLLKIHNSKRTNDSKLCFPQGLQSLPDALRLLYWREYPFKTLPLSFDPEKLVRLRMPHSQVEQLWDGIQHLPNLKLIDLKYSENLTCIPNLSQAPNLEVLDLDYCINLLPLAAHFKNLGKLTCLYMNHCAKQRSLPNIRSLETLELRGCQNLKNIPELKGNMTNLDLSNTPIEELSSSIGSLDQLQSLKLEKCTNLKSLPASICHWQYLTEINLYGCSSLEHLPDLPRTLRSLDVSGAAIDQLPTSIESLPYLIFFLLRDCKRLQSLPTCMYKLKKLGWLNLRGCSKIENFPDILEPMEKLFYLNLSGTGIIELPSSSVKNLPNLSFLNLEMCENLKFLPLPELPFCLNNLNAQGCTSLETLSLSRIEVTKPYGRSGFSNNKFISFLNCLKLDQNALNIIIADAQIIIIYMASRILSTEICHYHLYACICYPGNKIPKWFNYIADSSEAVQVPSNWHNSNFLGFAVCFVAEFEELNESYGSLQFLFEFQVMTKSGECHKSRRILEIRSYEYYETASNIGTQILNSDHVFMLYEYKSFLACQEIEEADNMTGFSFSIHPIGGDDVTACRVKTCGIRMLYLEEAQEFGLLTKPDYDWKSRVEEEEDDYDDDDDNDHHHNNSTEEHHVYEFFCNFGSNDCENKIRDCCEPSEKRKVGDDESKISDVDDSALKKKDCDTPSTSIAAIDYVEGGEALLSLNWSKQKKCHGTLNSVFTDAKEHEQEPNRSEIAPNSAAKDHEEDSKPSQRGTMDFIEADNEDLNSFANGCLLFLSHIKAICKGIFGNKAGNELNQESSFSSGSVQERLQALEVTIQNLQSENAKLRDQSHQLSQQYLQMPATMPRSPLLELSSPFPMQLPGQNMQILQYYPQMVPADHQGYTNEQILHCPQMAMSNMPPTFPSHPSYQNQHVSQHWHMMMSRPLGFPANQADHLRPSSSSQQYFDPDFRGL
ncbi:TMV resistance protein N-like [Humulus lupulus]|uniref:TMV resistance protein N-like n=1 Tax=Humulus lupulus TaxID=3486 RepID=UPI002B409461|nr:TMV resistance protein N-like [Humulus lupulus]XP_062074362.1 TMV resistance protein N-like [Humulus lupulus]XP_062074363.1 TMV resistance protein N-like [Humulus lupulus]